MPPQVFVFVQLEFPWALGPADGRYLLRDGSDGEAEHVVVIETIGARRARVAAELGGPAGWVRRRAAARGRERPADDEPADVETTRATVVDPVPLSAESQAQAWLSGLDREREVDVAVRVLNRVVHTHRIAAADPYVREVSPAQALVIRAGWGEGEQVAYGQWLQAREISSAPRGRGRRRDPSWARRPQERLAALLGGRGSMLLCEELTLRARLDFDQGRLAHAAVGLDRALAAAVAELTAEGRQDLALRIAELAQLHEGVAREAQRALGREDGAEDTGVDREVLEHALGRLEAALRARTAPGV